MMARFPFTRLGSQPGSLMPRLSLEVSIGNRSVQLSGIIDSGSALNVLPYHVGSALGAQWDRLQALGPLAGGMAGVESRALPVTCALPELTGATDISLLFAWASSDSLPILLGQTNFLMEFNVCFYRKEQFFEVWRAK